MKVSIDVISRKVVGISLPASPFVFSIDVPDNFTLSKTIQEEILPENPLPIDENIGEEIAEEKKFSFRTVTLLDTPNEFTLDEVLAKKMEDLLKLHNKESILLEEFLDDSEIDFTFEGHSANTGVKFVQMLPLGKIKLKNITLIHPSKVFKVVTSLPSDIEVKINNKLAVSGRVEFAEEQNNLVIVIENTSNTINTIESLSLVY